MKGENSNFGRRLNTERAFGFGGVNDISVKMTKIVMYFDKTSGAHAQRTEDFSIIESLQNG